MKEAENAVKELLEPTERIMEQISSLLESGEIQLIIGDDASGRVPTAIFRKIFDIAYKERGFIVPETRFITGSRRLIGQDKIEKKEKIAGYFGVDTEKTAIPNKKKAVELFSTVKEDIEKKFGRPFDRALIVTDTVQTGVSLAPLVEVLNDLGVKTTVASIGFDAYEEDRKKLEDKWQADLINGIEYAPEVFGHNTFSGVRKEPEDLFSILYKTDNYLDSDQQKEMQGKINKTREMADLVAKEAYGNWKAKRGKKIVV